MGLLLLHPILAEELAERVALIPLRDKALDSLRSQILSLVATHNDLDADAFMTQLIEGVALAPDMAQIISTAVMSARTALPATATESGNAIGEARAAVTDLLQCLESDSVYAELRQQAAVMDDESSAYDRLRRLVASERQRLADGQG